MLECSLWHTTSAETKLRLRAMDVLREPQISQRVVVAPSTGTSDNRGAGDVLTEKEREMRAVVIQLGDYHAGQNDYLPFFFQIR